MSSLDKGPWTTKLSSAGLVFAFYGKDAIKNLIGTDDQKLVDMVYDKVSFFYSKSGYFVEVSL